MRIAHFIVSTVEGCMVALCGEVIGPKNVQGAQVGIYGKICSDCDKKVKEAWVTVKVSA